MVFAQRENELDYADTPTEWSPQMYARPDGDFQTVLLCPTQLDDLRPVVDHLSLGHLVVVNMEKPDREMARRMMDFLAGVAYGKYSQIQRVAASTYLVMPEDMPYTDESMGNWDF